jgi:hypothetical protein
MEFSQILSLSTKSYSKWIFYMIYLYFGTAFLFWFSKKQIWTAFFLTAICKKRMNSSDWDGLGRQIP